MNIFTRLFKKSIERQAQEKTQKELRVILANMITAQAFAGAGGIKFR